MTNIAQHVWKLLDNEPCIRRNMSLGLLNIRSLATYLIKQHKLDSTVDAVISAIRRYKPKKHEDIFITAHNTMSQSINISTKSRLAEISLIKDSDVQSKIPKLFEIIQYNRGDVLRITQANVAITLLVDEKNIDKITELIPKDKIIATRKNIAEINVHIHPQMQATPGILAVASNELAINNINIIQAMTCPPEMLWFVKEEDLLKAYNVLYQLCRK